MTNYLCKETIQIANKIDHPIVKYDYANNKCMTDARIDSSARTDGNQAAKTDKQIQSEITNRCNLSPIQVAEITCKAAIKFIQEVDKEFTLPHNLADLMTIKG